MKSTYSYFNPLTSENLDMWNELEGSEGNIFYITLAEDEITGDYTRLTLFKDGYDSQKFGAKSHDYPEEIFVVKGRLYDKAFGIWLEEGHYASRPPFELHGPFVADGDVVIFEISNVSQRVQGGKE
ncbi:hypothetical protein FCU45_00680 [Sulfurimonas crateris]|uniref:ChrR-like cupin domain-containing protein n=1 Tax=Sulfurimonas crateris TaxID=2574727 RepID=A0A4U2Z9J8_9BACT|nr:cupin domain-containing protein [Sulfurimonas crateris]TKI70939.1 hypothetical protein FCU45_00680 [Sulfurimonas crateris]